MPERKVTKVLLLKLEQQGCRIKPTKSGYMILCPNGDAITIHKTESDYRAIKNIRARIIRADLTWPAGLNA